MIENENMILKWKKLHFSRIGVHIYICYSFSTLDRLYSSQRVEYLNLVFLCRNLEVKTKDCEFF